MKTRKNQSAIIRNEIIDSMATIPQILFREIPGRSPDSVVLKGEIGRVTIRISLEQLRSLVLFVHSFLPSRNIKKGSTIMLMKLPGSLDIMSAVYFYVFTTYGIKVFLAEKCSTEIFEAWIDRTGANAVLLPMDEFTGMEAMESEKSLLAAYKAVAKNKKLTVLDTIDSFPLYYLLDSGEFKTLSHAENITVDQTIKPEDDAVVLAIPGPAGTYELITFKQNAFSFSTLEKEMVNLYDNANRFSFTGFHNLTTPVGLRGLIYRLWHGREYYAAQPDSYIGGILAEAIQLP